MQYIFRTYAERFAPIFRKKINENCNRKILRDNEKLNLNFVENLQRQFSDFSNLETILNRKLCVIFETENQTLRINVVLIFFSSWKYNTVYNSGLH